MPLTDEQRQTLATALGERAGLDVFPCLLYTSDAADE